MTTHKFIHQGFRFEVTGNKVVMFTPQFDTSQRGIQCNYYTLRQKVDYCISAHNKDIEREKKRNYIKGLSKLELIAHKDFAYARFKPSGLGDYYNIYWKDISSPTGVSLVGGCTAEEWELYSKETNNSHNYLSPSEKY